MNHFKLSNVAYNFNLRRYTKETSAGLSWISDASLTERSATTSAANAAAGARGRAVQVASIKTRDESAPGINEQN